MRGFRKVCLLSVLVLLIGFRIRGAADSEPRDHHYNFAYRYLVSKLPPDTEHTISLFA